MIQFTLLTVLVSGFGLCVQNTEASVDGNPLYHLSKQRKKQWIGRNCEERISWKEKLIEKSLCVCVCGVCVCVCVCVRERERERERTENYEEKRENRKVKSSLAIYIPPISIPRAGCDTRPFF